MWQTDCPNYQPEGTPAPGERILAVGGKIVDSGIQRVGNCGEFVEAVYNCAGYREECQPNLSGRCRFNVFGSEGNKGGPYLEKWDIIRPGDWIMYINLEYDETGGTTHSTIFVCWIDKEKKIARTLNFVGKDKMGRDRPGAGEYAPRTLTKVYCIRRAVPGKEEDEK
jgi:hypothetical protein